jgi:glycine/D-amino acid oxidase-like deaminating enzyme
MDLRSDYPFWLLKDGIINTYPSLNKDLRIEIVIVGAGITGALMAYYLGKAGFRAAIIDRRHVGMGSTAASTGFLQYEIDTPLRKLVTLVGEKNAIRSYSLCVEAITKLHEVIKDVGVEVDFEFKSSFQYASKQSHVNGLKKEFELRKANNLSKVEWLGPEEIKSKFGFDAPGGILSADGAQINAYKLTHHLLTYCIDKFDLQVYDNTTIVKANYKEAELITSEGKKINAKRIIICAGYESGSYLPMKVEKLNTTYAIISEPLAIDKFWFENALIWETAVPYLYMRTTQDNRILVGGRDDDFYNPTRRDRRLPFKAQKLVQDFKRKFPRIPFKIDFEWAGTFCGTKDGLPFIGKVNQRPSTYFALGFGGNGITFSLIAAEIIRDVLTGKKNEDASVFSFNRL